MKNIKVKKNTETALFYIIVIFIIAFGFMIGTLAMTPPREAKQIKIIETEPESIPENITESIPDIIPETPIARSETAAPEYKEITVAATAYCPCIKCCGKTDGITATGTKATAGRTIGVDPEFIPYGTEVIINGNTYVAEDCGGAIKGNDIDIYYDTHEEALQFGRQTLTAYIIN